jgi:hypothetical protein
VEPVHNIILSAAEMSGKGSGLSDAIKVAPQVPTRYVVTTPASAVAGQKFPLKIMVYNQIGNPMKHYNLSGPDVTLIATGSGRLSPSKIPASEFVNGVASVEAQYDRSEAFAITAEPASAVVAPSAPVTRAQPAATPAGKADGKKKPAVATKPAGQKKVAKTKEAVEPKKEAPVADTRKEIITTPAAPTAAKAEPIQVRAITLSETAKRSVVAINVEGLKKHGTTVVKARPLAVSGKNWIVLSITPAVNKIVEPVTFDSDLLGQVVVEEVKNGTPAVIVKIEQKTASKFKVEQTESFITVSVGN